MRLIDANALKESLKELKVVGNDTNNDIRYIQGLQDAVDDYFPQIIDDTPTIDVKPVKLSLEDYDKGYADGYSAAMKTVQGALLETDIKGNDE